MDIPSFSNVMKQLYDFKDVHGSKHSMISYELYKISEIYEKEIEDMIDYNRDFYFNFFGFKTLERAYLMKINGKIMERPQHMWMRVSIGIHKDDIYGRSRLHHHICYCKCLRSFQQMGR